MRLRDGSNRHCNPYCQNWNASRYQQPSTAEKPKTLGSVHCGPTLDPGQSLACRLGTGSGTILTVVAALALRQIVIRPKGAYAEVQKSEVGSLGDFSGPALRCLSVGGERCCQITPLFEMRSEIECPGGVAPVGRASVGVDGKSHLAMLFQEDAEIGSGGGMPALICATEGRLRTGQLAVLFESDPEIESSGCISALIRAVVRLHRAGRIALLFEEQAEMVSGCSVAALIGATIGRLGLGDLPSLFEQCAQTERARGIAALVRAPIGGLRRCQVSLTSRRHDRFRFETIAIS